MGSKTIKNISINLICGGFGERPNWRIRERPSTVRRKGGACLGPQWQRKNPFASIPVWLNNLNLTYEIFGSYFICA